MTTDLVLDDYTLLRFAQSIRTRAGALENGGSVEAANNAFFDEFWVIYNPEARIPPLEEFPDLNRCLIEYLEAKIGNAPNKLELWEKFEVMRRLAVTDYRPLMLPRPE